MRYSDLIPKPVSPRALVPERAYHGSPHKFDRFSLDHLGTGEGAQAYGYGLYFAGKKEVAEFYRDAISYTRAVANKGWVAPPEIPKEMGAEIVSMLSGFFGESDPGFIMMNVRQAAQGISQSERYIRQLTDRLEGLKPEGRALAPPAIKRMEDELASATRTLEDEKRAARIFPTLSKYGVEAFVAKGTLYHVEIPEEDEFLLWDTTLDKQPGPVTAALEKLHDPVVAAWRENGAWAHVTGETLYKTLSGGITRASMLMQKETSERLHGLGIAGIKYFDAGSRTTGDGTYNYVVFDDSRVSLHDVE